MGINEIIKIGGRIKKLRKEKGLTQKEMANLCEIPYSTYSNYENDNREPGIEQLEKISSVLNITLDDLIGYESKPNVQSDVGLEFHTIQEYKDFQSFISQYNGPDYTKEEIEEIKKFAEFLKSKRES